MLITRRSRSPTQNKSISFGLKAPLEHEFLMALNDKASGLRSYIAIHNTNLGLALGGTRMIVYKSDDSAIEDALNLSRAMSYKCALANLPYGGGKGVIMLNPETDRAQILKAYARLIDKLGGLLKTGTDVGISDGDVALMYEQTPHMLGVTKADRGELTTSKAAALGVYCAMKAALTKLNGTNDFKGVKVAIKGAGKLGEEIARLVVVSGGEVYISDINPQRCYELCQKYPSIKIIDNEDVHKQQVDIYSPCALGNEFSSFTIKELNCRAIVGGANNQLTDENSGNLLYARGIIYAPDYITNAGGLIYVADELEPGGFNKHRVIDRVEAIEQTLLSIFDQAEKKRIPTNVMADLIARTRISNANNND